MKRRPLADPHPVECPPLHGALRELSSAPRSAPLGLLCRFPAVSSPALRCPPPLSSSLNAPRRLAPPYAPTGPTLSSSLNASAWGPLPAWGAPPGGGAWGVAWGGVFKNAGRGRRLGGDDGLGACKPGAPRAQGGTLTPPRAKGGPGSLPAWSPGPSPRRAGHAGMAAAKGPGIGWHRPWQTR